MKKYSFCFLIVIFLFSCSYEELENEIFIDNDSNIDNFTLRSAPIQSSPFPALYFDYLMPIYRSYYKGSGTETNHIFSSISPSTLIKDTYYYYDFRKKNYKYEGLPFYTFYRNDIPGMSPKLILLSKWDYKSNNDYLIAIPDMAQNPSDEHSYEFCGYIFKTWLPGLVPLREYYCNQSKNSFYIASEEIYSEMGSISGSLQYQKILGYVVQNRDFGYFSPTYLIVKFSDNFPVMSSVFEMKIYTEIEKKLSNGRIEYSMMSFDVDPKANVKHYFPTPDNAKITKTGFRAALNFGPPFQTISRELLLEPEYFINNTTHVWDSSIYLDVNKIGENIYIYNFSYRP